MPHFSRKYLFKGFKFNRFIFFLTLNDVFTFGLYTVLSVLAGLYLAEKLQTDVVAVVGYGVSIYWLVRASFQIPIGLISDRIHGFFDEILFLAIGNCLMGFPYLLYPLIDNIGFYYVLQIIFGIGVAFNIISWRKLFAKHLDRNKEGIEYGIYELIMGIAIVIFGLIGGKLASLSQEYFEYVIVGIGVIMISSSLLSIGLNVENQKAIETQSK